MGLTVGSVDGGFVLLDLPPFPRLVGLGVGSGEGFLVQVGPPPPVGL